MKQRIREIVPLKKGTYISRTYDGFGEYFFINGFVAICMFICKLIWYPIKYTIGLPFVLLAKILGRH